MTLAEVVVKYQPHRGLRSESLIRKLAAAPPGTDPWRLDLTRDEQQMLGRILAEDDRSPSVAEVERAVAALTAKRLRAHARDITQEIAHAEASGDGEAVADLLVLKQMVNRALDGLEE
jgi:hypothetical protein